MKLKIITAISLVVFFVFMTSVFTAGLLRYEENKDAQKLESLSNDTITGTDNSSADSGDSILSEAEISKHSSKLDCWVIIEGNVYDLTGFIPQHPGGGFLIEPYCGKDTTNAFTTRDKTPAQPHSAFARNLLRSYYIGPLGKTPVDLAQINSVSTLPTVAPRVLNPVVPTQPVAAASSQSLTLTMSEIATHNTLQNCWLLISGNVYDVTRFITQHPGGVTEITNWCGKDATTAFQTRGGKGGSHSTLANNMLATYIIGSVGSSVAVNTPVSGSGTQTGGSSTTTASQPGGSCTPSIPSSICAKYPSASLIEGGSEDDGRWEGKVNTTSGCRAIKTNSSGAISSDQPC